MKKLLSLAASALLAFGLSVSAQAKTIQVSALEDFNTANPPAELHVQMNANTRLDYDLMLFQGYQVTGKVTAQQGGFEFTPVSYVNFQEEKIAIPKAYPAYFKGPSTVIRQDQPFFLIFPENGPDTFQYYVPSSSDINK